MDEYKRFLKSAYRLADPHLREEQVWRVYKFRNRERI
jgi:hypothetical protein